MAPTRIDTLDLNFQGRPHAIASFLIRQGDAVVLIESGPGSTLPALAAGLAAHGLTFAEITHVLLTHIHLDHGGAAGFLAGHGAEVYVHPLGAPHLLNPEKLIASATRIYGERMNTLWGEFLPVPPHQLNIPNDAQAIQIGGMEFTPLHTPGHAEHHFSYLFEDVVFCGDVGGVRIPGYPYLRVPMPPPELHLERWHASIARLRTLKPARIAPTHFGLFDDPEWHFAQVEQGLNSAARWLHEVMPADPPLEDLRANFTAWMLKEGEEMGLDPDVVKAYELANPLGMSADGLQRYWKKVRMAG